MQAEKFIDEIFFDDYEVLTPDGFKNFKGIGKTIEFQEYVIHFKENSKTFVCADEHIVILQDGSEKFVKDLEENDKILSNNSEGYLTVGFVEITKEYSNMYDLLGVKGEVYNTSDIVSHNSTVSAGVALHYALFNSHFKIGVLADKDDSAKELFSRIMIAFENLPKFLMQGVKKMTEHEVILENNSKIFCRPTSKKSGRGKSLDMLLLDEFAHVDDNISEDFYAAIYPTISANPSAKLVIISTPNHYNLFHTIWTKALLGENSFNPVKVLWNEVPGHDEAWKEEQIRNTSEELFNQEHGLSFEASTSSLIKPAKIEEMISKAEEPIEKLEGDFLKIYEKPIKEHKYLITVDSAKGVGGKNDFLTFEIFDITQLPYKQVAVYKNNDISRLVFPTLIQKLGLEYNEADIFIENNDNWSGEIASILYSELEYPNLIFTEVTNKLQRISYGYDRKSQIGLRLTSAIKKLGCSNLKNLIEHDKLIIKDYNTISEISSFVRIKDSYGAEVGKHDDLVMPLVLFAWLTTQDYFKDIEQNVADDIRNIYESNIDQGLKAIGFLITGREEHDNSWYDEEEERDLREGWRRVGETLDDDQLSLLGFYK